MAGWARSPASPKVPLSAGAQGTQRPVGRLYCGVAVDAGRAARELGAGGQQGGGGRRPGPLPCGPVKAGD